MAVYVWKMRLHISMRSYVFMYRNVFGLCRYVRIGSLRLNYGSRVTKTRNYGDNIIVNIVSFRYRISRITGIDVSVVLKLCDDVMVMWCDYFGYKYVSRFATLHENVERQRMQSDCWIDDIRQWIRNWRTLYLQAACQGKLLFTWLCNCYEFELKIGISN